MDVSVDRTTNLTWINILFGFTFIALDAVISYVWGLKIGSSLITASLRCVVQLAVMAAILKSVFEMNNPWAVASIACLLNILGAIETVLNRSPRRHAYMLPTVLTAMMTSTIPISLITTRFIMSVKPFWRPDQYIPIVGMLAGATVAGVVVALTVILKEVLENKDKIETYLAFGASRREACLPIAQNALLLALTPTVNQMSVVGIIAIPGMMTGALLGGSSVDQASKLQMIIMFCISASTALGSILATILCLLIIVDSQDRIRTDRIDNKKHTIWQTRDRVVKEITSAIINLWQSLWSKTKGSSVDHEGNMELQQGLLSPRTPA